MSESVSEAPEARVPHLLQSPGPIAPVAGAPVGLAAGGATGGRGGGDFLYYGLRNKKLVFGLSLELLLVLFAIIGPMIAKFSPQDFTGAQLQHPDGTYWLGTDYLGHDIFSELTNGLRESYLVGALGAVSASVVGMALGFTAGWRGGILDEVLQMITNIIVMIPALVLLVVIGSYLNSRSVLFEGVFIGLTTWPWVARAVRAQTFTLRSREFVELAKLSGKRPLEIIVRDIAPNMASYLFLVVILLFGSSMLLAASYDFLGLGPTDVVSLGSMMNQAQNDAALLYHDWWWFIPPGAVLTAMVWALLIANVGLDEVFNPKLRQQ
ncbi:ABC transporter permease [Trebonia sp.]|uniref:ABC transporter permease n=1 Tax=Trebonia sp. TaxID=2767075 RepID=UPI002629ACF2|nr:ABC transporter permease [Trebonia sp.]